MATDLATAALGVVALGGWLVAAAVVILWRRAVRGWQAERREHVQGRLYRDGAVR